MIIIMILSDSLIVVHMSQSNNDCGECVDGVTYNKLPQTYTRNLLVVVGWIGIAEFPKVYNNNNKRATSSPGQSPRFNVEQGPGTGVEHAQHLLKTWCCTG